LPHSRLSISSIIDSEAQNRCWQLQPNWDWLKTPVMLRIFDAQNEVGAVEMQENICVLGDAEGAVHIVDSTVEVKPMHLALVCHDEQWEVKSIAGLTHITSVYEHPQVKAALEREGRLPRNAPPPPPPPPPPPHSMWDKQPVRAMNTNYQMIDVFKAFQGGESETLGLSQSHACFRMGFSPYTYFVDNLPGVLQAWSASQKSAEPGCHAEHRGWNYNSPLTGHQKSEWSISRSGGSADCNHDAAQLTDQPHKRKLMVKEERPAKKRRCKPGYAEPVYSESPCSDCKFSMSSTRSHCSGGCDGSDGSDDGSSADDDDDGNDDDDDDSDASSTSSPERCLPQRPPNLDPRQVIAVIVHLRPKKKQQQQQQQQQ